MEKQQLQNKLYLYRVEFNKKWKQPYPNKIDKDYFKYYIDVLKGKQMVIDIKKFDADLKVEDMTNDTAENIFI